MCREYTELRSAAEYMKFVTKVRFPDHTCQVGNAVTVQIAKEEIPSFIGRGKASNILATKPLELCFSRQDVDLSVSPFARGLPDRKEIWMPVPVKVSCREGPVIIGAMETGHILATKFRVLR